MSWPNVKLKDVCELAIDCVNKTAPYVDYETQYKMLRTTNVRGGFVDVDNVRYVTEETYEKWTRRSVPQQGDVLLTREAPLGDVGRLTSDDSVFLGQRLFQYRANPKVLDSLYLAYVLQSPLVQGRFKSKGFGATVQHAKVGDCENLEIPLPDLDVQIKIGEMLANYDDLIENNRRRIQLLEESARLLYKEWFVQLRFPGHEHVKIVDGVPEGWVKKKLSELCYQVKDGVKPSEVEEGTHYIGLEHIPRRSITLCEWETSEKVTSNKFAYKEGDLIFGKIRPYFHKVGFTLTNGIASSDAIVVRACELENYAYLLMLISSDQFVALASKTVKEGAKMPRADWKFLMQQSFIVPSGSIMGVFQEQLMSIIRQLKVLAFQNKQLAQARDILLPRLMNGTLPV